MIIRILSFSILLLFFSCKSDSTDKKVKAKAPSQNVLQAVPNNMMAELFEKTTYIDYIFYELPFSISQDNKPSITANLGLIGNRPMGAIPDGCKPIGREFFTIDGDVAYEADLYFSEGCYGYVFLKDDKPIYANNISDAGKKFYQNIINQASQVKISNGQ